ncbi:MAG: PadR family transcriptional regulator [Oscillibacter sp.]|jgi:PadR family transcriptional regulator PadR|nr:PadR family transcriptional regulator [Oscillibacter sp.]
MNIDDQGIDRRGGMKIDKSLMSGSTTMLILSLLAKEEMYGYQMIVELARRSNRTFELKEGTLYPILHGLEAERLVTVREKEADGRVRKYYRITKKGLKALEARKEEWSVFTEQVNAVIHGASLA